MVLRKLLGDPPPGTCPFCHQKAGILSREHPECRKTYQAGWDEMVSLAAAPAPQCYILSPLFTAGLSANRSPSPVPSTQAKWGEIFDKPRMAQYFAIRVI